MRHAEALIAEAETMIADLAAVAHRARPIDDGSYGCLGCPTTSGCDRGPDRRSARESRRERSACRRMARRRADGGADAAAARPDAVACHRARLRLHHRRRGDRRGAATGRAWCTGTRCRRCLRRGDRNAEGRRNDWSPGELQAAIDACGPGPPPSTSPSASTACARWSPMATTRCSPRPRVLRRGRRGQARCRATVPTGSWPTSVLGRSAC